MTQQNTFTVLAGQDGGLAIYESSEGESILVFGGDRDACEKYLGGRMAKIVTGSDTKTDFRSRPETTRLPVSQSLIRRIDEIEPAA